MYDSKQEQSRIIEMEKGINAVEFTIPCWKIVKHTPTIKV